MNTRDIRFFMAVCESESINLAAERLYISPQGLSSVINKIEKELGAELFVRSRAGTYLTEYGEVFKLHAAKMLDHYEDARRELAHIRDEKESRLRLGYAFGALSDLATDLPMQFQELHQEYKIEYMELPDRIVEDFVSRGELDIGFTSTLEPEEFDATKMYEQRILFVAHSGSKFYDRESVSAAEICDEPLTLREDNFATTRILMREFDKYGRTPSVLMRTGGIMRSMVFCTEQKANTIILERVDREFSYDNLHVIPFKEDLKWPLYMITRKGRPLSRAARAYIDFINEQ